MTHLFAAIYAYSMSNGSSYAETQLFYPSLYCEVPAQPDKYNNPSIWSVEYAHNMPVKFKYPYILTSTAPT